MSDNLPKELIVDPSSVKDIKKIVKEELKNLPEDKIGSIVEGNPEGEATEVLTKLSIKNEGQETIFGISAGGKLYKHDIHYYLDHSTQLYFTVLSSTATPFTKDYIIANANAIVKNV